MKPKKSIEIDTEQRARELGRGMAIDFLKLTLVYAKEAKRAGLDWNTVMEALYEELGKASDYTNTPD